MAFTEIGANTLDDSYSISNSLRFDQASSHFLSTTFSSAGNRKTFTISTWCKLGAASVGGEYTIMGAGGTSSGNPRSYYQFEPGALRIADNVSGSSWKRIITNAKYQDHSAWYHLLAVVDTTQGTESNRMKLFVNGTQVTSLGTEDYPSQNVDLNWNNNTNHYVGAYPNNSDYDFEGYLADFYFIDGTAYTPSDFGETDEDTGIWIPKDAKDDLTFGSNGFFLEFKQTGTGTNASGIGADTSGNDNHLASNNLAATDVTTDTPTNNFATFNPLIAGLAASGNATAPTYSEGNCKTVTSNSGKSGGSSTIQMSSGKWYAEFEFDATNNSGSTHASLIGVTDSPQENARSFGKVGERANDVAYSQTGQKMIGDSASSYGNSYTTGDIIGVAVDLDNNAIYFSKNGTFQDSGDPTSGASKTGAIALTAPGSTIEGGYYFAVGESTSETSTHLANFGNPPFSISSGNADANGYGNFEYAVPSGYYALCTKNLAKYG